MEDYDKLKKQHKKMAEKDTLKRVLKMALESLTPDVYDKFIEGYNQLIKHRDINLEPVNLDARIPGGILEREADNND